MNQLYVDYFIYSNYFLSFTNCSRPTNIQQVYFGSLLPIKYISDKYNQVKQFCSEFMQSHVSVSVAYRGARQSTVSC